MNTKIYHLAAALLASSCLVTPTTSASDQSQLTPIINTKSERTLKFDWPAIKVGTAEYAEGPTGVTVIRFDDRATVAVDARGGGPGTINTDYMNLGYGVKELDTIVFAGGSWYGLEAVTAVASALKDDGIRDGNAFADEPNIAMSVGSIIFDFGTRRLNEIYPDKKLAQAAFRAAKTGSFAQGAHGAGRFAKSGGLFGCNAFSGQGAAFKQIGDLKIAAFVIANPYGVIADRDGKLAACYKQENWPDELNITDLLKDYPNSMGEDWTGPSEEASNKNTTVSLIVTNQKMEHAELQRLAVQVHTSMNRAIQPFASIIDGDVLYAVSTQELDKSTFPPYSPGVGVVASEVMWDAILNSVPEQPKAPVPSSKPLHNEAELEAIAGTYHFSKFVDVEITAKGNQLFAQAIGERRAYAIPTDKPVALQPVSKTDFTIEGRYPLTIRFAESGTLTFNPGHWQQIGKRK